MKNHAMGIASKVINAHMHNRSFNYSGFGKCDIALYSKDGSLLYGDKIGNVNFNKDTYQQGDNLFIVDQSAQMHLGVKYIVLKDSEFSQIETNLLKKVVLFTILALLFVGIIGYFLGRLFLKPIASERERLDKFIKNTTHELNTPITALLMSTSSLKNENSKVVERIKTSSNRISHIYSDLCYLIKKDLPHKKNIETLNIKDIIEEQILLQEGYAKSKHISIEKNLHSFEYKMEKESAVRLISNLLSNALKYSKPNTKVTITFNSHQLSIQDEGIGIKEEDLKQIKKRYVRANSSEGGFGIGLDIVNNITQKYNIGFKIESTYGKGSVVTLTF